MNTKITLDGDGAVHAVFYATNSAEKALLALLRAQCPATEVYDTYRTAAQHARGQAAVEFPPWRDGYSQEKQGADWMRLQLPQITEPSAQESES